MSRPAGDLRVEALSAVTLACSDLGRSVDFYRDLGFELVWSSETFASFQAGEGYLNLVADPDGGPGWWGRVIFWVADVDAHYARALDLGLSPEEPPRDAEWGERYFHLTDPDGHELSFARPLG